MPNIYEVKDENTGNVYEISTPDGTTEQQATQIFLQQYPETQRERASRQWGEVGSAIGSMTGSLPEESLKAQRAEISKDATLQAYLPFKGQFDTGIPIPQWLDEGLAGAGRELMELGTAGRHQGTADELLDDSTAASVGAIGADIAGLAGVGTGLAGLGAGATALGAPAMAGRGLLMAGNALRAPTSIKSAAAGGAALGGWLGDGGIKERAKGAGGGAIGGGLGVAAPQAISKVIAPKVSQAAKALLDKGVRLTPGQMLGKTANAMEQQFSSLPVVGGMVSGARRRGMKDWNKAVMNDALKSVGGKLPKDVRPGKEAFDYAHTVVSKRYNEILESMPLTITNDIVDALGEKPEGWKYLGKSAKNAWKRAVNDVVDSMEAGEIPGKGFKKVESQLRRRAKLLSKSMNPSDKDAGEMLSKLHKYLMDVAGEQHPEMAQALKGADSAYAKLSAAGEASLKAATDDLFTPAQLTRATAARATKKAAATGRAPGLSAIDDAADILPSNVPDSGTAGRMFATGLVGGGLTGLLDPTIVGGGLLAAAPYTRGGGALIRGYMQPNAARAAFGEGVGKLPRYTGLLGMSAGSQ